MPVQTKTVHLYGPPGTYDQIHTEGEARMAQQVKAPIQEDISPTEWQMRRFWVDMAAAESWVDFVESCDPAPVSATIVTPPQ